MSMDYNLAKELKDAGFSQKFRPFLSLDNGGGQDQRNSITFPSLSELIEACGDKFDSLVRVEIYDHVENKKIVKFRAQSKDAIVPDGRGSTPEIAVARLWLSLNKQPTQTQ